MVGRWFVASALWGCGPPDLPVVPRDTGDVVVATEDTGVSSPPLETPVQLDDLLAASPVSSFGCAWAYIGATNADIGLVLDLALPPGDPYADVDVHYDRDLGPDDVVYAGIWPGTGTFELWECTDVLQDFLGSTVFHATSGHLGFDATYVGEVTGWSGIDQNPRYSATISLTGATLVDDRGEVALLSAFTTEADVGMDYFP